MRMTLLELADLQLDLLYVRDEDGRILRTRTRDRRATPSYHLTRTTEGNRWLVAAALPEEKRNRLEEALRREPVVASAANLEDLAPAVTSDEVRNSGPGFHFPDSIPAFEGAELLRDSADVEMTTELAWIRELGQEQRPFVVARSASGEVVSACHSSRSTERGAEAGVQTAEAYRGLGLAVAVVSTWAVAVRGEGRTPLYSTEWSNAASRAVAWKLGMVMYGEDTIGVSL